MRTRIVSGITLTILLLSMLTLAFNIQPVKASGAILIRADGSVKPDTTPISSLDNITYTFTDNIFVDVPQWSSAIVLERDNIVVDGAGYTVQGTGSGIGIHLTERSNITIQNLEIKTFYDGIELSLSSNIKILGNNITANREYGIMSVLSSNISISGNNVTNNDYGIISLDSSNISISGNNVTNNYEGIVLVFSSNNTVSGNMMNGNQINFEVFGDELSHYIHTIDVSNLVDGKPVYYLINQKDLVINPTTYPQVGYLAFINSINITVEGLTRANDYHGLLLAYTNNSKITNSNITNNRSGITTVASSNNSIYGNNIANNSYGISLSQSSNCNSIHKNNLTSNYYGVMLSESSNNIFYYNSFMGNTWQVHTDNSTNIWDDGYPSGGNYWSDYEERYPDAQELDGSGIWDTPYVIDENNQDNYPLMEPWSPTPPSPVEATQELIETIETWNLSEGLETSLTSKLDNVIRQIDKGNEKGATHKLVALINQIGALRGKKLTSEQANYLIAEAQRIIDLINR